MRSGFLAAVLVLFVQWPVAAQGPRATEARPGRLPALTAEAQRAAAARANERRQHPADGPEDRSLQERCLVFNGGPPFLTGPYNNFVQLIQTRDDVIIQAEMIHDARVVPLNGRPHHPARVRT